MKQQLAKFNPRVAFIFKSVQVCNLQQQTKSNTDPTIKTGTLTLTGFTW